MNTYRIPLMVLLVILCASSLQVHAGTEVDGVTVISNQVCAMQGGELETLKENLELPFEVEVNTNGSFKVADGKERQIQEGQVIRSDGWLVNTNGSIQPVFDHVAMLKARVYVVRDGLSAAITNTMVFPNNMSISPDGHGSNLPGGQLRLNDGELFDLNGTPVPAMDSASLQNGRLMVQKDGTLVPLTPAQVMGMNDGTSVCGNGIIIKRDGTRIQLHEGQTILIEGPRYGH